MYANVVSTHHRLGSIYGVHYIRPPVFLVCSSIAFFIHLAMERPAATYAYRRPRVPSQQTSTPLSIQQQQQQFQRRQQYDMIRYHNGNGNAPHPTPHAISPLKPVYKLLCRHCRNVVCARGMRAILLADTNVELYSTDIPAQSIQLMDKDYLTRTCHCRIRDIACRDCGNLIGYHVVAPCTHCLQAGNNGHFWMFHTDACQPMERKDTTGKRAMLWQNLPRAELDFDFLMGATIPYSELCR